NKKIAWVSWVNVCKPKKEGGLGVRDLCLVNNDLLGKWRWRIISEGIGIWHDFLLARYGTLFPAPHLGGRPNGLRGASSWWTDVSLLGTQVESQSDWFSEGVFKRIGNGILTSCWFDHWVDSVPLRIRYQSLFQDSDQGLDRVVDMGKWVRGEWVWKFRWRINLGGVFSVKSAYLVLDKRARLQRILPEVEIENLARVWDSWASPKVIVFSWQLLQDRVPTRQNLRRRRVLVGTTDTSCVFCGAVEESGDHLFVSCERISPIWYRITRWLGIEYVCPNRIMQVFESFFGMGAGHQVKTRIAPALSTSERCNLSCVGPIKRGEDVVPGCFWFLLSSIS
ncbi:ribonuclease H protein, partial [Trifolium medium]|nr:ribonuclease H protein [Trifolium medium]